jgi:profilin
MSWQEYVDSSLVGSGLIAQAAIVGHDGTLWATSSNLSLGTEEIAGVIKALQDIKAAYNGLMLAGEKVLDIDSQT